MNGTELTTFPPVFAAIRFLTKAWVMKKRPFRLTFIDRVKIGLSDVPEIAVAFEPRVVHKDVDFAELCCSVHDKFLSVADAANVLLKSGDLAPGLLNTCPQPRRLPRCSSDNRKKYPRPLAQIAALWRGRCPDYLQ